MRVKRYVVDSMPDAMLSIRNELGSDARHFKYKGNQNRRIFRVI